MLLNIPKLMILLDFLLSRVLPLLIAVAYYVLLERKLMASVQRRKGPNVAGFWGSLLPLADGLKLFLKENIIPYKANKLLFVLAPCYIFALALIGWTAIPFSGFVSYFTVPYSLIFVYMVSSLAVYGIIGAGWSSNSKYAFLGGLRSAAQMISYEVALGFVFLTLIVLTGSLDLRDFVWAQEFIWFIFPLWPLALVFYISMLAETNRVPFDLPEAEAELVAGFNVEYSGMGFAFFFLGEYANMILMSSLFTIFFLGGWLPFFGFGIFLPGEVIFGFKVFVLAASFVLVRTTFPRVRYDQLMGLGWRWFLPFTLFFLIFIAFLYLVL